MKGLGSWPHTKHARDPTESRQAAPPPPPPHRLVVLKLVGGHRLELPPEGGQPRQHRRRQLARRPLRRLYAHAERERAREARGVERDGVAEALHGAQLVERAARGGLREEVEQRVVARRVGADLFFLFLWRRRVAAADEPSA